ncbi:MAG: glycosyltransferase, partial [Acidimicrobiales bacterium]
MKVLHVLASNDRRGAEVFAVDLAHHLDVLGVVSTVVAVAASTSTAIVDARPLGTGLNRHVLRKLRAMARDHDVVIAHGSTSLPACAMACLGTSPFVYRSIGDPAYWSSAGLRRFQTGLLLSRAHTVIALWAGAAFTLEQRGIPRDCLAVIPNAVSADSFPAIEPGERARARAGLGLTGVGPAVLYLGSLSPEKCPQRAVQLGLRRPDLQVLIVGDGPLREQVERESATADN